MKLNEQTQLVKGHLTMRTFDKESGELIDEWADDNVITLEGYTEVLTRLLEEGVTSEDSIFHTIYIGDDFGTGDLLNPEEATQGLTGADQAVVYEVRPVDMEFNRITSQTVEATTFLDGTYIMDTFYPNDVDLRYCSATLRFRNEKTMSYKRFPARSISRLVSIQMVWAITFDECETV